LLKKPANGHLVVGQHAFVLEAVDVAVDLPLQVGHPPAPVDEEQSDGEDDLQARPSGQYYDFQKIVTKICEKGKFSF
jgi:hypothetical protein